MIVIIGCLVVLGAVIGGFMMSGGHVGALLHISEFIVIGGADDLTGIKGKIRFDANQEKVLIEAEHKGRKIGEVQLGMGSERIRELNGYRFKFESYGRMTTFSVTKLRHKKVRYAGLFFAVCGTLLWATFRPCRVWIQSQQTGCFIESNRRSVMKGLLQWWMKRREKYFVRGCLLCSPFQELQLWFMRSRGHGRFPLFSGPRPMLCRPCLQHLWRDWRWELMRGAGQLTEPETLD